MWFKMEILQRWMQAQPMLASAKAPKSTTTRIVIIVEDIATTGEITTITIMGTIAVRRHRPETPPQTVPPLRRT